MLLFLTLGELRMTINKANQILNDVEIKTLTMPLSFSPKRNIVFICCNCRAEFSIDSDIKGFNCPDCDAIFKKNEDGGYIEQ